MDRLSESLKQYLYDQGAALCGFADLHGLADGDLPFGVSVALRVPKPVLESISDGPTPAYFDAYHSLNDQLDGLVTAGADFLKERRYNAFPQTRANVFEIDDYNTRLPHKTVATRAGLGWIGKSALFVSFHYGPAIRLSSLLTDAPLTAGTPVTRSRCGNCTKCMDACPGRAISGKNWYAGLNREEFFDAQACRKAARELSAQRLNKEITLCGKCFEVCPYTKGGLRAHNP
jgi:epoxyqueuosine reductase QueG